MEGRRRVTLYDQMTAGNSSSRDSLASLMLDDAVFSNQKRIQAAAVADESHKLSRTLQDIIREDEPANCDNNNITNTNTNTKDRKSWKAFKDKLRLKRATGSAWSSTVNNNDNDNNNGILPQTLHVSDTSTQRNSDESQQPNDVIEEDVNNSDPINRFESPVDNPVAGGDSSDEENENTAAAVAAAGVSLMHLLEETEQEIDSYRVSEVYEDEDEDDDGGDVEECCRVIEEEEEKEEKSVVEYNCCVCMVRHKGAAFIPCGHTFCRMCSREIWVSRGNCPLCNNLILEILDIF
ncbi:hypothetical protein RJT34_22085 [Clitoria ternatea]|uniref:RING-type domain-containing protein n=1 Tax=Clitoria ternatea TaxID=43366 RepID=A0AAN9P6Z3_CLITE